MSRAGSGRACRTRSVRYAYEAPSGFDETAMERLLRAAQARRVITDHDTGRGRIVWFSGPPGAALRSVRRAVLLIAGVPGPVLTYGLDDAPVPPPRLPRGLQRAWRALLAAGEVRLLPAMIGAKAGLCYAPPDAPLPRGWSLRHHLPAIPQGVYAEALAALHRRGLAVPRQGFGSCGLPATYRAATPDEWHTGDCSRLG